MKWHISRTRRQQFKDLLRGVSKFSLTVVCSALLGAWLQMKIVPRLGVELATSGGKITHSRRAMHAGFGKSNAEPSEELSDFYAKYLEEVLKTLRQDRRVRMVKLEVPNTVLTYQRFLASQGDKGTSMKLTGRGAIIPVIAVSRGLQNYLEEMRVTYIDPKTIPSDLVESNHLALGKDTLSQFLLVPDLTGPNARRYSFTRR